MTSYQESNKILVKPLATTAGIIGLIQGISWTVLSVLCVLCYYEIMYTSDDEYKIYYFFFDTDTQDRIVTTGNLFIFVWFYLVFSVIWTCVSGAIVWSSIREKWNMSKSLFGTWSVITILIAIVDVVLTTLIGIDYGNLSSGTLTTDVSTQLPDSYFEQYYKKPVALGIVMTIAGRGYVLWLVNVIFAIIMAKFTINILKQDSDGTFPIIHGYESNESNTSWQHKDTKDLWASPARRSEGYENYGFVTSHSFQADTPTTSNAYPINNRFSSPQKDYDSLPATPPFQNGNYNAAYNFKNSSAKNNYATPAPPPQNPHYKKNNAPPPPPPPQSSASKNNYSGPPPPPPQFDVRPPSAKSNEPTSFAEAIAQKTATIGRGKTRGSSPVMVPPPHVPEPDYTPPGTPSTLKSVLRSQSHYNGY